VVVICLSHLCTLLVDLVAIWQVVESIDTFCQMGSLLVGKGIFRAKTPSKNVQLFLTCVKEMI